MTIIKILDEVRNWLDSEICGNFTFKKDPGKDKSIDAGYNHELVKPKAFILYPPFDENLYEDNKELYKTFIFNNELHSITNTGIDINNYINHFDFSI